MTIVRPPPPPKKNFISKQTSIYLNRSFLNESFSSTLYSHVSTWPCNDAPTLYRKWRHDAKSYILPVRKSLRKTLLNFEAVLLRLKTRRITRGDEETRESGIFPKSQLIDSNDFSASTACSDLGFNILNVLTAVIQMFCSVAFSILESRSCDSWNRVYSEHFKTVVW